MPWLLWGFGALAALGTRVFGISLSGRIQPRTPIFDWFACVGQALVGGLMIRVVFFPTTALSGIPIIDRAVALICAFIVFFLSGHTLFLGAISGVAMLLLMSWVQISLLQFNPLAPRATRTYLNTKFR